MHTQVAGVGMGVTGQEEAALRAPYTEIIDSFLDLIYLVGCGGGVGELEIALKASITALPGEGKSD